MAQHKLGIAIPGAITSTDFARKPSTHLQAVIESGQPLIIIKHNHVLAAIVPVGKPVDEDGHAPSNQTQSPPADDKDGE